MNILSDLRCETIHDGVRYSYRMRHHELYAALGLNPNRHLPYGGLDRRFIGNVLVWVVPKSPHERQDAKRVWCQCPHCHKVLTAGKFHQHMKVHR